MRRLSLDSPVINRDLAEALKAVTSGMNKVINEMKSGFDSINKRFDKVDDRFSKMDKRFDKVDENIEDLKTNPISTVSRNEFTQLKSKVDKYLVD